MQALTKYYAITDLGSLYLYMIDRLIRFLQKYEAQNNNYIIGLL